MKKILGLVLLSLFVSGTSAQTKSPAEFLGYKIGDRFTPHWKIVDYFKHVAATAPTKVKLIQYGETNEGRPLLLAVVSSAGNISNLENIRVNNLRLALQSGDNTVGTTANAPAIVWLSYNVHGNEASSSETSMLTLYSLINPSAFQPNPLNFLNNTVVLIDPCLNPDGRDRYVNWYNSVSGKLANPSIEAREHHEPWPGGRTNHYNFDLNRDWAWQTQVESQQRLKIFQQWMPQIHVDFHEQYPSSPYYFAPAAEPYHEVITKWQRDFQNSIGRNHARYFDTQGWLYFTKQYFDLLYPSYGDTYPLYNGSIGMTYEQAGHGMAGLAIQPDANSDTLTLLDRATHHFTTSLSTIEVASKNAVQLVTEFQRYFADANSNGVGNYKSYLIKNTGKDASRINGLIELLDKNHIRYGKAKGGSLRGYNYENGKDESFTATTSDLVITTAQPKGALVKVLFEPKAALADSFTYDITAWSLPYVYGLPAFASTQKIDQSTAWSFDNFTPNQPTSYGYVIRWDGLASAKLATRLLQQGIRLRVSESSFESGGQSFDPGSVIVVKTGNQYVGSLWDKVRITADSFHVKLFPVVSGFVDKGFDFGSNRIHILSRRKVALLTGDEVSGNAAGEVWNFFEQTLNYPLTLVNASDAARMNWSNFDVVILPDGNYSFLSDKTSVDQLRTWISRGGHLIALENAVSQLARQEWSIKAKKAGEEKTDSSSLYNSLRSYQNREREFIPDVTPGSIFRVELDNTHPLAYGYPKYYYTLKSDDRLYDFIKDGGWNVGVIKKEKQVAGYVGSRLQKKLQDGLLFGVQDIGDGTVTYFTDNVLFRNFWENGKLMFVNAVFLVGQ